MLVDQIITTQHSTYLSRVLPLYYYRVTDVRTNLPIRASPLVRSTRQLVEQMAATAVSPASVGRCRASCRRSVRRLDVNIIRVVRRLARCTADMRPTRRLATMSRLRANSGQRGAVFHRWLMLDATARPCSVFVVEYQLTAHVVVESAQYCRADGWVWFDPLQHSSSDEWPRSRNVSKATLQS